MRVVRNGEIKSAHYLSRSSEFGTPETGPEVEADSKLRKTIPQLFAIAIEAAKSGTVKIAYRQDGYEFPGSIYGHAPGTEPFIYEVYDFALLK
jgi:hypothetical protein